MFSARGLKEIILHETGIDMNAGPACLTKMYPNGKMIAINIYFKRYEISFYEKNGAEIYIKLVKTISSIIDILIDINDKIAKELDI